MACRWFFKYAGIVVCYRGPGKAVAIFHIVSGNRGKGLLARIVMQFRRVFGSAYLTTLLFAASLPLLFWSPPATGHSPYPAVQTGPTSGGAISAIAATTASEGARAGFRVGEVLRYTVAWSSFRSAATAELSIPETRELGGWRVWHFRARVDTISPVRTLFAVDDQFDSYADTTTFVCRQFEMYLDELGRRETTILHPVPFGAPIQGPGPFVSVLPGTRDALSALYDLRSMDWQHTSETRMPVYDGHNLYEMVVRRGTASEKVSVAAGEFTAAHLSIRLNDRHKEMPQTDFELWIASERGRLPLLMTANLPFGSLRVELTQATE
jgi:hypothetical protein